MTMLVNYNIFAKGIAGVYSQTTNSMQKSISKLSTGLRMSVTDYNDASGMEIAQQITSKINGYSKAMAGGQDGMSLLQTAEGALTEVDAMLQRMRELANQAANDTLTGQDRAYIQAEMDQLRNEIDRIGNTTRFNNKNLLNGNAAALWSAIPKETQAIIKGSLKSIDQFGQKDAAAEGNYSIKLLAAPPGEAEVQKSSVFKAEGEPAGSGVKLKDTDRFDDLLDDPQTITITQGDGKTANITLYADDTLGDAAKKINDAISNDLGQGKYVNDKTKFATFVDSGSAETSEAVAGTLLIRSAVSGSNGTLHFSGSEDVIKALGLNTIQEATESVYEAKITDAHSGAEIKTATVTGNKLNGVLHDNVDVEFDGMAGVTRTWDDEAKAYKYNASSYDTTVHLSDNTLTLQMGIRSNEDMSLSIGDMRSQALGIDKLQVMDRESASHALSVIDSAIDTVSTQRAKLGAYINRIEYNIDNMRVAENNMGAAESNIRDTDYAKEIINFTKMQITMQANNAMLAQANQTQERVLDLLK